MAKVPRLQKRILEQRVDPGAVRRAGVVDTGISDIAGGLSQAAEMGSKYVMAKEATKVSEQSTAYERDVDDFYREFQTEAANNPAESRKDFDQYMNDRYNSLDTEGMSGSALRALNKSKDDVQYRYGNKYKDFERNQSVKNFGTAVKQTVEDSKVLAYRAGQSGESVDDQLANIDMATIAGSTFVPSNQIGAYNKEATDTVLASHLMGVGERDPDEARRLLKEDDRYKDLPLSTKQNIFKNVNAAEGVIQNTKVEEYKNAADELYSEQPFKFIEEAEKVNRNGDDYRAAEGWSRKSYDAVVSYNKKLSERHKTDSLTDFYKNPSTEGLEYLKKINPQMTEKTEERLTDIYETTPNYEATTTFSGYERAYSEVLKLALMPNETLEQKEKVLDQTTKIMQKMKRSNRGDGEKGQTISQDNVEDLSQALYSTLGDSLFRKELADMPDVGVFENIYNSSVEKYRGKLPALVDTPGIAKSLAADTVRGLGRANKIKEIGLNTSEGMVRALLDGDKAQADKLYRSGLDAAIKEKYYYLPEMQGELKVDKTTVNINGKPYLFKGFGSEDILLEILD